MTDASAPGPSAPAAPPPVGSAPAVPVARRGLAVGLLVGGALFAGSTWLASRVYDALADRDGIADLDRPMLRAMRRFRGPVTDATAATIARVFGPVGMPILTLAAALAASVPSRRPSRFLLIAATGLGSLAMTVRDKELVQRVRPPRRDAIPPYETSPSFPSGHTLNATAISGIVVWVFSGRRPWRTVAASALTGAVVGASRLLLGAHWLTDVLFAWFAGAAWLQFVATSDRLFATEVARRRARRGAARAAGQSSASTG